MRALPSSLRIALALAAPGSFTSAQGVQLSGSLAQQVIGRVSDEVVSPDGTRVVFAARVRGSPNTELFSTPVEGGFAKRLTLQPGHFVGHDFLATISPDSQYVLYFDQGLFRVPIDGGPTVRLTPAGDTSFVSGHF